MNGTTTETPPIWAAGFAELDRWRQWRGRLFDRFGLGAEEAPWQTLAATRGCRVRVYDGAGPGTPILIVPAPIKRPYIWDLAPDASVVRHLLASGFQVFLIEWQEPGPDDQTAGLDDYADRMIAFSLDAVAQRTGQPKAVLTGHSLGGTLSAIFACRHADRLLGLLLIESPLHFGSDSGAFAPMVAAAPPVQELAQMLGGARGSFLSLVSVMAAPDTFLAERLIDRWLIAGDKVALKRHLQVERWTLDEFPLPRRLFEQVVEDLYREDRLFQGSLMVAGGRAGPSGLRCPLATVVDPRSRIIPPASVVPFHQAAASPDKLLLPYQGDTGVALQHVGALVGNNAHAELWPRLIDWLKLSA